MDISQWVSNTVDKYASSSINAADRIWEYAELGFKEENSSKEIMSALSEYGFKISSPVAGIPTAFTAEYGEGKPVIGLLAEYDALAGVSQKPGVTFREELIANGNGHGCGHNLLGAACISSAVAVKDYLFENKLSGTIVVFGCPAEENGSGKTFMAREGVFDNVDIALSWHPSDWTGVVPTSTQANAEVKYNFKGKSAHAAAAPHMGRSALDAVELMDVGANYLREHVTDDVKFHYAVSDTGGISPNVVQAHSEVTYLIRAAENEKVMSVKERIDDIARGAALMTGTSVSITFMKASSELHVNSVAGKEVHNAMKELGNPSFSDNDRKTAADFSNVLENPTPAAAVKMVLSNASNSCSDLEEIIDNPLNDRIVPFFSLPITSSGSSDVGDVSLVCPTAMFMVSTAAQGTVLHSWQMTSQGKTDLAHAGMLYASKVMALTSINFINNKSLVEKAWEEHNKMMAGKLYVCPIPEETPLPFNNINT